MSISSAEPGFYSALILWLVTSSAVAISFARDRGKGREKSALNKAVIGLLLCLTLGALVYVSFLRNVLDDLGWFGGAILGIVALVLPSLAFIYEKHRMVTRSKCRSETSDSDYLTRESLERSNYWMYWPASAYSKKESEAGFNHEEISSHDS